MSIDGAIAVMWERYSEPLTLTDLADAAYLSRFYFSRVFREKTGTSPGRFLSAVRLCKAKQLLLETSLSVGHIAYMVGYNSMGTFTSRFGRSIGVSPARYRLHSRAEAPAMLLPSPRSAVEPCAVNGRLHEFDVGRPYRVYIGAFDSPIPQGIPCACVVVDRPGRFLLRDIPDGTWFIRAAAVPTTDLDPKPWRRRPLAIGDSGPVCVRGGDADADAVVRMRLSCVTDVPILLLLPELDCWQVAARAQVPVISS